PGRWGFPHRRLGSVRQCGGGSPPVGLTHDSIDRRALFRPDPRPRRRRPRRGQVVRDGRQRRDGPARRLRDLRPGPVHRDHGAVGFREVHVPALPGGAGHGDVRVGADRRRGDHPVVADAADPAAPRPARVRVPVVQPAADADGGGEHPADRAARRPARRPAVVRHGRGRARAAGAPGAPAERAVGRAAAAGGGRAGAADAARGAVRRRADRQPGLGGGRGGAGVPAHRGGRVPPDGDHGDARPGGRRARGPGAVPGRRDDRPGASVADHRRRGRRDDHRRAVSPGAGRPAGGGLTDVAHRAPLVRRAGDTLRVTLPKRQRELKVVGIVTVEGRSSVARGDLVLAPPETVREAAGLPPGAWHGVLVKAAPGTDAARLGEDLARDLAGSDLTVRTASAVRDAHSAELRSTGAVVGGAIGMVSSVAVFVGVFVVANTFGTLVRQRTRRLALLGAIGATPRQIKRLIRLEALALGAVASAGGVLVGYPVSAVLTGLFARDGFDVSAAAVPGVSRATALTATEAKLVSPPPRRSGDDSGAPLYLAVTGADQDALPSVLDLGGNLRPLRPGEIALTSTIMEGQRLAKGR